MVFYYAKFLKENNHIIRTDTRIYFGKEKPNSIYGNCLGIFFLKNPGSASPKIYNELCELEIKNDKTLPWIANSYLQVIREFTPNINNNDYIRVLNLFTICEPNFDLAINLLQKYSCYLESIEYSKVPFLFVGWGNDERLNPLREEYLPKLKKFNTVAFYVEYYYLNRKIKFKVREGLPSIGIKVKHPIGLRQSFVVEKIKDILRINNSLTKGGNK